MLTLIWLGRLSLGVVVLIGLFVVGNLLRKLVRNKWGLLLFGFLVFGFGMCVYYQTEKYATSGNSEAASENITATSEKYEKILHSADLALSSFFLSRGDGTPPEAKWEVEKNMGWAWQYYAFHFCCVLFVFFLGKKLFGTRLFNEARLFFSWMIGSLADWGAKVFHAGATAVDKIASGRRMSVFWGETDREAQWLAKSLKNSKTGAMPVFVVPVRNPSLVEQHENDFVRDLTSSGFIWVHANPKTPGFLLRKAKHHFFIGDDWTKNVERASELISTLKLKRTSHVYVRIGEAFDEDLLYRWADSVALASAASGEATELPEIHVLREESLVSKSFLWKHPMSKTPGISTFPRSELGRASGDFRVLLVGYGAQGKVLLNDIVCDAQLPGTTLTVDIIDKDKSSFESFESFAAEATAKYRLAFSECDVRSADFWQLVNERLETAPWNRIVISMQDDFANFQLASAIARVYRQRKIPGSISELVFARVRSDKIEEQVRSLRMANIKDLNALRGIPSTFGLESETYTKGNVVDERQDNGAKFRNWLYYHEKDDSPEDTWLKTRMFDKESSRASVFGIRTILRLIGMNASRSGKFDVSSGVVREMENLLENPDIRDLLAEAEHDRWMAFLLMRGIKVWDINKSPVPAEVEEIARKTGVKANRQKQEYRHAALVPYGELKAVAKILDAANETAGKTGEEYGSIYPSKIATDDAKTVSQILQVLQNTDWNISQVAENGES